MLDALAERSALIQRVDLTIIVLSYHTFYFVGNASLECNICWNADTFRWKNN